MKITEKTDLQKEIEELFIEPKIGDLCPICGEDVYRISRCITCLDCGWSVCEN